MSATKETKEQKKQQTADEAFREAHPIPVGETPENKEIREREERDMKNAAPPIAGTQTEV